VEPAKATLLLAPFALQYCYVVVLDWFGSGHSHPTVLQVGFLERTRRELYQQYENQLRENQLRAEAYWKAQFTLKQSIDQQYKAALEQWKLEVEEEIRQDATKRSKSVMLGQITEHLVPFLPDFKYNPKDARFLGTPVDLIVFDGLSDGQLKQVVFIEVKSGSSKQLTQRENKFATSSWTSTFAGNYSINRPQSYSHKKTDNDAGENPTEL